MKVNTTYRINALPNHALAAEREKRRPLKSVVRQGRKDMISRIQKVMISLGFLLLIGFFVVVVIASGGTDKPVPGWTFIILGVAFPCFLIPGVSMIVAQRKRLRMASACAELTGDKPVTSPDQQRLRFAKQGEIIGASIGSVATLMYAMSPANPDRGHLLGLKSILIIAAATVISMLLGRAIGYGVGRFLESKGDRASSRKDN